MTHSHRAEQLASPDHGAFPAYEKLLERIEAEGYQPRTFLDPPLKTPRILFLRHDVDISPILALDIGRKEQEFGVRSSFFFQLNAGTYNCFDDEILQIIQELRKMGHCVGLHLDSRLLGLDPATYCETLNWFNQYVTPIDHAISLHRPAADLLHQQWGSLVCTYDRRFFNPKRYFSDSKRDLTFPGRFFRAMREGLTPLQALIHPEWWGGHATVGQVWEALRSRRERELASYCEQNFPTVFEDLPVRPIKAAFGRPI